MGYYDSDLALHPAQNKVFIAERNLSPSSIYQVIFDPATGASGNVCFYNSQTFELVRTYPALPGTRFVGGVGNYIYAAALQTNRLFVQRLLSPAIGGETNTPAQAAFTWSPQPVGTFQTITFDASATLDNNTPANRMKYRWDWEADGTFDTPFTNNPLAFHRFNLARPVTIVMQVKDAFGAVTTLQKTVTVVSAPDYGQAITNSATNSFDLTMFDAVFDPVRPHLYLTDSRSNRLVRIDLIRGVMDLQYVMDHTVESIAITPSGNNLFVAELFQPHSYEYHGPCHALINAFDLRTGARTRQYEIQEDPCDLIATDELLVVAGGSGGS